MGSVLFMHRATWWLFVLPMFAGDPVFFSDDFEALATIEGVVVEEDGSPVVGATVQSVPGGGDAKATTDSSGTFAVDVRRYDLPGMYFLATDRDGQRMGFLKLPQLPSAWETKHIEILLGDSKSLLVEVTGSEGQPLAGARVGIASQSATLAGAETDDNGQATLRVPASAEYHSVYAHMAGKGFDYLVLKARLHPERSLGWPADGRVELVLGPTMQIEVRVTDTFGSPIADLPIYPWLLKKPDQLEVFNLSAAPDLYRSPTDREGSVVFTDLPRWKEKPITFGPHSRDYAHQRISWDPLKNRDGIVAARIPRLVPISGRVELPDGSPAAGIHMRAHGAGYTDEPFRTEVTTRADGTFEVGVWPDQSYMLGVFDQDWGAKSIDGLVVLPGAPVEDIVIKLQPATRVHGRLPVAPPHTRVTRRVAELHQMGRELAELEGVALPNPENIRYAVQPYLWNVVVPDDEGRFEFFVGPGEYKLSVGQLADPMFLIVTDEAELEIDFDALRPDEALFSGEVIDGQTGKPVAEAVLQGIYRNTERWHNLKLISDQHGRFEGKRRQCATLLHARSADGRLAGLTEVGADDAEATISLRPLGSATGRIMDEAADGPLADQTIKYSVRVHLGAESRAYRSLFGGKTTTDEQGRFELNGLILGAEYEIDVQTGKYAYRNVDTITLDEPAPKELGDLVYKQPDQSLTLEQPRW